MRSTLPKVHEVFVLVQRTRRPMSGNLLRHVQDAKERFYLWGAWDYELLRMPDEWMEGFESTEEIVEYIIVYKSYIEEEATAILSKNNSGYMIPT
jgi:hypothetical protein